MSDWAWLRRLSDDAAESVLTEADVRRIVREEIAAQIREANLRAIEKELAWPFTSSAGSAASPSLDTADRTNPEEGVRA